MEKREVGKGRGMLMKAKKQISKKELCSVLLIILVAILVILSPFLLIAVLATTFPSADGYLLTGFSFCIFGFVAIMSIPIGLFKVFAPKKNKLDYIKNVYKKYKPFGNIVVFPALIILLLFEIGIVHRGSTYLKDIAEGPKQEIMMDAVVEVHSHRGGSTTYLVGYINGEKISLEVTRDAHSDVTRRESYQMLWITYYENIREVYDVDVFMK